MSLKGKIESEIVINTPPHRFYKLFKEEIFDIPKACPKLVQKINIHGGDWSKHGHGSIKTWHYTLGTYINRYLVNIIPATILLIYVYMSCSLIGFFVFSVLVMCFCKMTTKLKFSRNEWNLMTRT